MLQGLVRSNEVEVLLVQAGVEVDKQHQSSAGHTVAVRCRLDQELLPRKIISESMNLVNRSDEEKLRKTNLP